MTRAARQREAERKARADAERLAQSNAAYEAIERERLDAEANASGNKTSARPATRDAGDR